MKAKLLIMLAGIVLLGACKSSGNYSTSDTVDTHSNSVKLVKTADMRLKVKSVQRAGEQIAKLTDECGGLVMHHTMQSNIINKQDIQLNNDSIKKLTVYTNTADMVIKLPSPYVELFMDSLNHLGIYVDERKMDIEDRTLNYLSEKLKADNRKSSVALRTKIHLTQGGADSILALKDDMVDRKISNLKTDDAAKFSMLSLSLYQSNTVHAEVVANDDLDSYKNPLLTRMEMSLSRGWFYFSEMVVDLMNFWAFILAAVIVWFSIWMYRRKRKMVKTV